MLVQTKGCQRHQVGFWELSKNDWFLARLTVRMSDTDTMTFKLS